LKQDPSNVYLDLSIFTMNLTEGNTNYQDLNLVCYPFQPINLFAIIRMWEKILIH